MRAATNPGNFGHQWVRNRFQLEADRDPDDPTGKTVRYIGKAPDRPFIPSLAKDNPFLDRDEYVKSLQNLPKVVRDQLLAGDWSVSHDARYKSHWFSRRWSRYGMSYVLGPDGHGPSIQVGNFARVFFTVDPASSSREGPGDKEIWTKISESNMSWTVVCVWAFTHDGHLLLLFMFRVRDEIPQVLDHIKRLYRQWKPNYIVVESSGLGRGVYQLLAMHGLPVRPMHPHTDKVVRATNMMLLAERGRVWLPQQSFNFPWVKEVEDELFVWIGHTLQSDDIVDAFSLAGLDVGVEAVSMVDDSDFVLGDDDTYAVSEGPFVIS
jgi:predicted phage terminase large subunit-like protein